MHGQAWVGKLMDGIAGIFFDDYEFELMQVSDTRMEMVKLKNYSKQAAARNTVMISEIYQPTIALSPPIFATL
jgi:hypothetical protein